MVSKGLCRMQWPSELFKMRSFRLLNRVIFREELLRVLMRFWPRQKESIKVFRNPIQKIQIQKIQIFGFIFYPFFFFFFSGFYPGIVPVADGEQPTLPVGGEGALGEGVVPGAALEDFPEGAEVSVVEDQAEGGSKVGDVMRKLHPQKFFTKEEQQRIVQAIQTAEKKTSGEIRVHLARVCQKTCLEEAKNIFEKIGMTQTSERNGILFFLSLKDHQFVIFGDRGIHERVGEGFWDSIRDAVVDCFKQEKFLEGLLSGIERCGEKLAVHFPYERGDSNELSDELNLSE